MSLPRFVFMLIFKDNGMKIIQVTGEFYLHFSMPGIVSGVDFYPNSTSNPIDSQKLFPQI
jgi:hypothetical protein